jgi:hypothetical protein
MIFLAIPAGEKSSTLCQGKGVLSAVMILSLFMAQAYYLDLWAMPGVG